LVDREGARAGGTVWDLSRVDGEGGGLKNVISHGL